MHLGVVHQDIHDEQGVSMHSFQHGQMLIGTRRVNLRM